EYDSSDVRRALLEKGEWFGELNQITKKGRNIIVQSRQTLIRDQAGEPASILYINSDITEKKQIENQFLRTQRMENLGALAGGIAHDLNNILAPIMMAVEMIQTDPHCESNGRLLETISSSAMRGTELVKQILSFARGVGGEKTAIHLRHIATDVVKLMGTSFSRKITVMADVPRDLPCVHGDATQLHQVLLNLCVNARDAMMPKGGTLTIKAEAVELSNKITQLLPEPLTGEFVLLEVADSGMGMTPEIQAKIFEPFFTTKEPGKGTGLGLSTVMNIVKSHGGSLEVQSKPGEGTTFQVYFPVSRGAQQQKTAAARPAQGNGEQILVVDDENAIIEITCTTLGAYNYRALTANSGLEALEVFTRQHAGIDLVITDMMMPGMDGLGLLQAMRELKPDVKVIAVSGFLTQDKLDELRAHNVKQFLRKPFSTEKLLDTVRAALHDEPAITATATAA
ncbi:MAG TPA: ATP-binding protein, partial [Chthoniobacteraceae bacterium]|nr:ATP-binding protein [Chthoniobacteraceae bacterium]